MVLKHMSLSPSVYYQLEHVLQYAPPLFFLFLHLSTLGTACKIHRDRSTGIISGAPFVGLFVTSFVWTMYGVLLPDPVLVSPSVFGMVVGLVGCVTFHRHASPESASSLTLYTFLYPAALVAVSASILLANLGHVQMLGVFGAVIMICSLITSHLSEFQTVIRDRSTASLSYYSSIMLWFNSLAWATYGLIIRSDSNIFAPNILGFVVATLQLHLFVVYGYSFHSSSSRSSTGGSSHNSAYSLLFPCTKGEEDHLKGNRSDVLYHQI